jgi:hypothetical protein
MGSSREEQGFAFHHFCALDNRLQTERLWISSASRQDSAAVIADRKNDLVLCDGYLDARSRCAGMLSHIHEDLPRDRQQRVGLLPVDRGRFGYSHFAGDASLPAEIRGLPSQSVR